MLTPIHLEKETLTIQSFEALDFQRWSEMVEDVYALLSDNQALKYLPFKRLHSVNDADLWLKNALISLHCGRKYLHFIRTKSNGRIIGFIDIISPGLAKEHYQLQQYPYFIEFCIKTEYSQKKLMSSLLPDFLDSLRNQQVGEIAAVINRQNIAAKKLLARSGFTYCKLFDVGQDIYQFSAGQVKVA
ncbi:Protein N-acetyltransferase, RimJ/RimL family [Mucilaginibacter gossypiicola]|uniref:Protein N-acetyltransferase, RimJ/RimL family n=1 Tax=Mucilaginibacter gossypiicola TaxID=551995 RepID=A0A1H8D5S4_9SPHI|nr:GNAT family N-acetyltransferase [Mucilaginibacter gossypiicola]SEN02536.1 Protein N-acetyltransferase, RimJ/RimL family [Mucilaginibacter gossypiicola]